MPSRRSEASQAVADVLRASVAGVLVPASSPSPPTSPTFVATTISVAATRGGDRAAHELFVLAEPVGVGRVEVVDAGVDGRPEERLGHGLVHGGVVVRPGQSHAAEADRADPSASAPERAPLHPKTNLSRGRALRVVRRDAAARRIARGQEHAVADPARLNQHPVARSARSSPCRPGRFRWHSQRPQFQHFQFRSEYFTRPRFLAEDRRRAIAKCGIAAVSRRRRSEGASLSRRRGAGPAPGRGIAPRRSRFARLLPDPF